MENNDVMRKLTGLAAEGAYPEHFEARKTLKELGWEQIDFGQDVAKKYEYIPRVDDDTREEVIRNCERFRDGLQEKIFMDEDLIRYYKVYEGEKFYLNTDNGFSATAFVNHSKKMIIISYRGTNEAKDWMKNNIQMALRKAPKQYQDAKDFYEIVNNLPNCKGYKIIITGHSLGGALAALIGALKNEETYTFNPAGAKEILEEIEKKNEGESEDEDESGNKNKNKLNKKHPNITNYIVSNDPLYYLCRLHGMNYIGDIHIVEEKKEGLINAHNNFDLLRNGKIISNKITPLDKSKYKDYMRIYTNASKPFPFSFLTKDSPILLYSSILSDRHNRTKNNTKKDEETQNKYINYDINNEIKMFTDLIDDIMQKTKIADNDDTSVLEEKPAHNCIQKINPKITVNIKKGLTIEEKANLIGQYMAQALHEQYLNRKNKMNRA